MVYEAQLNDEILSLLIDFSKAWEAEQSCFGYRANDKTDIEGRRIFLAEENGKVIGYLFGMVQKTKERNSIMDSGTPYFEIEEIYVVPDRRSNGIGAELFRYAEGIVSDDAEFIMLSTATKNWKAIFHFYLDELEMQFWNARLFKKLG